MTKRAFDQVEFDVWLGELDREFRQQGYWDNEEPIYKHTGNDCWKEWFIDGVTPEDAMLEEVSNWDE